MPVFLLWYVLGGVSPYRARLLGARITGLAGHNVSMGAAMMVTIILLLNQKNRGLAMNIILILAFICLILTQTRLFILLTLLYIIYKFVFNHKFLRYLESGVGIVAMLLLILTMISLNVLNSRRNNTVEDEESTIRMHTIKTGVHVLQTSPLFGYGFGTFGSVESVKHHSGVYDYVAAKKAKQRIKEGGNREAYFFNILISSGLIGCFLFYYSFVQICILLVRRRFYTPFYIVLVCIVGQSFFNNLVQMPVFYLVGIYCAYCLNDPITLKRALLLKCIVQRLNSRKSRLIME